jgi:hypothetical protein
MRLSFVLFFFLQLSTRKPMLTLSTARFAQHHKCSRGKLYFLFVVCTFKNGHDSKQNQFDGNETIPTDWIRSANKRKRRTIDR